MKTVARLSSDANLNEGLVQVAIKSKSGTVIGSPAHSTPAFGALHPIRSTANSGYVITSATLKPSQTSANED
jgi:hypothetical protein